MIHASDAGRRRRAKAGHGEGEAERMIWRRTAPGMARRVIFVSGAMALVLGVGGAALAASTGTAASKTTISGCYNSRTGTLRVLTPSHARCGKGELKISWDKQGPTGPRGRRGAKGDTGPRGARGRQGPPGNVAGYSASTIKSTALNNTQDIQALALKPRAGKYIVNGEVTVQIAAGTDTVTCTLVTDQGNLTQSQASFAVDPNIELGLATIYLTDSTVSLGGPIAIDCIDDASTAYVVSAAMTAMPVAALNP